MIRLFVIILCVILAFVVGAGVGKHLQKYRQVEVRLPQAFDESTSKIECYVRWHKEIQGK